MKQLHLLESVNSVLVALFSSMICLPSCPLFSRNIDVIPVMICARMYEYLVQVLRSSVQLPRLTFGDHKNHRIDRKLRLI